MTDSTSTPPVRRPRKRRAGGHPRALLDTTRAASTGKHPGGRPKFVLTGKDAAAIRKLCEFQCSSTEIAEFFGIDRATLTRLCTESFGVSFEEFFRRNRTKGIVSLRRRQFQAAMRGDTALLIWLGKSWLGQSDKSHVTHDPPVNSLLGEIDLSKLTKDELLALRSIAVKAGKGSNQPPVN